MKAMNAHYGKDENLSILRFLRQTLAKFTQHRFNTHVYPRRSGTERFVAPSSRTRDVIDIRHLRW